MGFRMNTVVLEHLGVGANGVRAKIAKLLSFSHEHRWKRATAVAVSEPKVFVHTRKVKTLNVVFKAKVQNTLD